MPPDPLRPENLDRHFQRVAVPGTGRTAYQLTHGPHYCQALYYFIPSLSLDGRHLVYQRSTVGADDAIEQAHWEVLDLLEGSTLILTPSIPGTELANHGEPATCNFPRQELIYPAGRGFRAVNLVTLSDRHLFDAPEGRRTAKQNCISPCGRFFYYLSHAVDQLDAVRAGVADASGIKGAEIRRYDLDTGEHHLVIRYNANSTHLQPCGERHILFSRLPTEAMIMVTDYHGGWFTALRTQDVQGGSTCHYNATRRGLHYEVTVPKSGVLGGITCLASHRRIEFPTPITKGSHVAAVPAGDRYMIDGREGEAGRDLYQMTSLSADGVPSWIKLSGPWPTYSIKQKSHAHPRVTPCGRWVLLLGGDPTTGTNHLFLLDIRDVPLTTGLPDYAAEPAPILVSGAHS